MSDYFAICERIRLTFQIIFKKLLGCHSSCREEVAQVAGRGRIGEKQSTFTRSDSAS